MEKVCPVCNKLRGEFVKCKVCSAVMTDYGRGQEVFQDDYTANMPINDAYDYCIHIFKCESCGNYENIKVNKILV
ncbi:hypothetical protein M2651_07635 [Clostridium sp. SYSU_GA19001]|uniref:hypothetical protein n=1 Tax=Clostridium caldaquaticum TaxID=2940653 RepID=UPI0020775B48|nr:hypothetical protein [Clostridium caldaquaticum]MCM8710895.1 hypothetical protein [Clostridium caldaquaticum]